MSLIGVYGASGFGREVMPLVRDGAEDGRRCVFIDDAPPGDRLNGHDVLTWDTFRADAADKAVCLALAEGRVRRTLADRCDEAGVACRDVVARTAVVMDDVHWGEGVILCPFVTLTSTVRIGRHFHANLYSYVAHDCVIGDFVTFAPRVHCNGNVVIEDDAYIGTGAILRQGKPGVPLVIGRGAVVGMGAVVTRDVAPGETVVGNPARPITRSAG